MSDTIDLSTIEGRSKARSLGFVVPAEAHGSCPTVAPADDSKESEKEFQSRVIALAKSKNWRVYHTFDSRRSEPGFPDLILLRGHRQIAAELKVGRNKLTPEQQDWLCAFEDAHVETHLWTPACFEEIVRILS